jgi:hypothetical protein
VECWIVHRDLGNESLAVQHQQKSVWQLPPGHSGEIVAEEALFEYTPLQIKTTNFRRGLIRKIPASGRKYFGFVVRVFENGLVINEISTYSKLPALVDQSLFSTSNKAANSGKYSGSSGGQTSVQDPGKL